MCLVLCWQWFSPEVKLMMSVLNDVVTQTRRWYVAVHELASHDLEVRRLHTT